MLLINEALEDIIDFDSSKQTLRERAKTTQQSTRWGLINY